jgi:hypothetical protein
MALSAGRRLGAYEIVASLGAGGMGEVYRAKDTTLNRDVAVKILPELFALDLDRVARFRREAQVLASLNHSNIVRIPTARSFARFRLTAESSRSGVRSGSYSFARETVGWRPRFVRSRNLMGSAAACVPNGLRRHAWPIVRCHARRSAASSREASRGRRAVPHSSGLELVRGAEAPRADPPVSK